MTITNTAGETPKDVARRFAQLAAIKLLGGDKGRVPERESSIMLTIMCET